MLLISFSKDMSLSLLLMMQPSFWSASQYKLPIYTNINCQFTNTNIYTNINFQCTNTNKNASQYKLPIYTTLIVMVMVKCEKNIDPRWVQNPNYYERTKFSFSSSSSSSSRSACILCNHLCLTFPSETFWNPQSQLPTFSIYILVIFCLSNILRFARIS